MSFKKCLKSKKAQAVIEYVALFLAISIITISITWNLSFFSGAPSSPKPAGAIDVRESFDNGIRALVNAINDQGPQK